MRVRTANSITCAAEVFLATCLLHRENPEREDFTVKEIVERVRRENLHGSLRPGTQVHASIHCVANRRPNPLAHSMLYATGKSTRRLLRQGDEIHPERNAKHWPEPWKVPEEYRYLIEYAKGEYARGEVSSEPKRHPLLQLVGLGAEIWKGVDADEYIRELREGWE
jgi:hypothetical protein